MSTKELLDNLNQEEFGGKAYVEMLDAKTGSILLGDPYKVCLQITFAGGSLWEASFVVEKQAKMVSIATTANQAIRLLSARMTRELSALQEGLSLLAKEPQMKKEVTVTHVFEGPSLIFFCGTPDAIAEFQKYGNVKENTRGAYSLWVDPRYDFEEVLSLVENYG